MKLFDCDLCPKKLKCKLTSKKDELLKKWCGETLFKKMWDGLDKPNDARNFCRMIGFWQGVCAQIGGEEAKKFDRIFKDFNDCLMQRIFYLERKQYEKSGYKKVEKDEMEKDNENNK